MPAPPTNASVSFTVPDGVRSINVHEWGAGGGASPGSAVTSALRIGGGSGYASGAGVSDGAAVAGLTATSVAPGQGTPPAAARRNPFYLAGLSWGGGDASSGTDRKAPSHFPATIWRVESGVERSRSRLPGRGRW